MGRKKKGTKDRLLARQRAELIMQVRSGQLTATEAAAKLGVSRKTYYMWENRALAALMAALETKGSGGRPKKEIDPEKEKLAKRIADLAPATR